METKVKDRPNTEAKITEPVRVRYCLYARKSTEQEEKQVLSIDSQIREMERLAEQEELEVVEIKKESHSAKEVGQRPVFNEIVEDIKQGKFTGILTWAPDRIARNAGDLGKIVDFMDQGLLTEIRTYGQKFTNSPNDKFMMMILGSQAKLENDNKVVNVKRGLRARCEMGLWPCMAPTGYLNHTDRTKKCHVIIDPARASVIKEMFERVGEKEESGRSIYKWLKEEKNFTTKNGKHLTLSNIYLILRNHFYYGTFEYPAKSGNWYEGKHEPLISKELFDRVQEQLNSQTNYKNNKKEFAFTKIMVCGNCGSGITAQEKHKKLKGGGVNTYIYYNCTKSRDKTCKEKYIREDELIQQLTTLVDQMDISRTNLREKLKSEIDRFQKFQAMVGDKTKKVSSRTVDTKKYVKYILENGETYEKRFVMESFKSNITLKSGQILLDSQCQL